MDRKLTTEFVDGAWDKSIVPTLTEYIRIPNKSPAYDADWENPLIEAPSLVMVWSTYYLFYSANWWNTNRYSIGYATATHVLGPYAKVTTQAPWFSSNNAVAGPGGQEWFTDRSGDWHMAYHGWEPSAVGYPRGARSLRLASVSFDRGAPVVA